MSPKFRPIFRWLVLGFIAAAGITYLVLGGHQLFYAHQSKSWPSVGGLIITTEVRDGNEQMHSVYEYTVDAKTYTGDQLAFGETSLPTPEAARNRAEQYPAGTPVLVYHHPKKHGHSTLKTGAGTHLYRMPLTGAALLFFGVPLARMALLAAERRRLR